MDIVECWAALDGEAPATQRGRYPYGPPWEQFGQWHLEREGFDRAGVTAHYWFRQEHPELVGVTVHGRTGPQVIIAGTRLIGMVPSAVEESLVQHLGEEDLVHSGGGDPGSYALSLWMRAARVGDVLISEARFCAADWQDED